MTLRQAKSSDDRPDPNYNSFCKEVLKLQRPYFSWLESQAPLASYGKALFATPFAVPLLAEEALRLALLILRYVPDRLRNFLEAVPGGKVARKNNGKSLHCWEARRADGTMVAECPELFRRGLGDRPFSTQCAFGETNPTSRPYGKTMEVVFPPRRLDRVMKGYGSLMAGVLEAAARHGVKVLLGSKGVVEDLARLLGGKGEFEQLRERHPQLFINLSPDPCKFVTMFHPECITNPGCLTFIYEHICKMLDRALTALLVFLTGDESAECTFGAELYEHVEGTEAWHYVLQAKEDLYERLRERWRDGTHPLRAYYDARGGIEASWRDGTHPLRAYYDARGGIEAFMKESWRDGTDPLRAYYDARGGIEAYQGERWRDGTNPLRAYYDARGGIEAFQRERWHNGTNPLRIHNMMRGHSDWLEKYAQLKAYGGRDEARGTFVVRNAGAGKGVYKWWRRQIGLETRRPLLKDWQVDLLKKAGVDFETDRVQAALDEDAAVVRERMADRETLKAAKRAKLAT